MIDIYGDTQGRDLGAISGNISKILSETKKDLPRGSYVAVRGQVQTMDNAYSQLYFGLAGAVVLIYLVIVVNFQSWLDPFIIITALPGALAGIIWMLFTTGTTLSVPALTGAIMCMGIATANSVLLVSFAREGLENGLDATAAALEAGFTRFRPVLMTALAMIIGMVPMALALGEGGEQNAPLGRAVIGGLTVATVATLFFVPTVFSVCTACRPPGAVNRRLSTVWIVQIALRRPYTFVVLSLLIALFGIRAALFTPTDIFPNINIPVISVVWTYNGLLPNDMSGRVIYYYERTLTSQVGDIEHLESQSLSGYGVVKIFFQRDVDIAAAMAQVTAASQTVLKLLPPGITPPYVLSYNASSVPILQLALSSQSLPQMKLFDLGQNFIRPQLATVQGAAVPSPYGGKILQVQVDLDQQAMQSHSVSAEDLVNAVSAQNLILPAGDQKIGKFDWNVALNASPTLLDKINDLPVKKIDGTIIYVHDVAFVHQGSPPQTNVVRVNGARAVLMTILKAGSSSTLDIIDGVKSLLPRVQQSLPASLNLRAVGDQSVFVKAAVFGVIREAVLAAALVGVMILLFLGSWRSTIIILTEIPLAVLFVADAAIRPRRNHQRHDAGRSGARRRHPGRRRNRDNRKHQLPSRAGQADRTGDPRRRAADRHSSLRDAALPLHRVRADVPARRRRRISVQAAGRSRGVCADRLVHPVAHAGADHGQLSHA